MLLEQVTVSCCTVTECQSAVCVLRKRELMTMLQLIRHRAFSRSRLLSLALVSCAMMWSRTSDMSRTEANFEGGFLALGLVQAWAK